MSEVEPDRAPGAPHPRETTALYGQSAAEAAFLQAFDSGRLHHGWLLTGPRGVGKATLAWRIARFLLSDPAPPEGLFGPAATPSLDVDPDHPVARRLLALSEPGFRLVRRSLDDKGKLRQVIAVEDVRALKGFFGLSATDGGRRVVIVDAADDMNPNAANALLKLLEEPPPRATLLLVAHQPQALLPTIRSRCRVLKLSPLGAADMAAALSGAGAELPADPGTAQVLAELSGGSVGAALELLAQGGLQLYARLIALLGGLPHLDRAQLLALAESTAGREGEARFALIATLLDLALSRLARAGASGQPLTEAAPGEAALPARLCHDTAAARRFADLALELGTRARAARAVNLDPAALVLDMFLRMESAVRELPR